MKMGAIAALAAGVLLLCVSAFFGIYSVKNAGSAERLSRTLPRDAAFVVRMVEAKAARQRNYAIFAGLPAVVLIGVGVVLMKKKA
jgi:hypothetical protein